MSVIEAVISELKVRLAEEGPEAEVDIDLAWRAIHAVVRDQDLKKSELLTPMRHALTARQVSAGPVPIHFWDLFSLDSQESSVSGV